MSKFLVSKTACKHCLFSNDRLVEKKRADSIVQECLDKDTYFVCHTSTYNESNPDGVCCRSFFNKHGRDVLISRAAIAFGAVEEVELKEIEW